jgi:hypothetical protein
MEGFPTLEENLFKLVENWLLVYPLRFILFLHKVSRTLTTRGRVLLWCLGGFVDRKSKIAARESTAKFKK